MKKIDKEDQVKLKELLAKAEQSPIVKQLQKEEAEAVLLKRTAAFEKIKELESGRDQKFSRFQKDLQVKEENHKTAKAKYEEATNDYLKVKAEITHSGHVYERAIGNQRDILLESADPAIDEAKKFFNKKLDWLRKPGRISREIGESKKNIVNWTKKEIIRSNGPAVRDALDYCRAAINALEKAKLIPSLDVAMIEKLKKNIPDINVYASFSGHKDMEKGLLPGQRRLDNYESSVMNVLMGKADLLLNK
jgi:hypothetical protein